MSSVGAGGACYIGSHSVLSLLQRGHDVVIMDNLINASRESINRVEKLTGKTATFFEGDILDSSCLRSVFSAHRLSAVIHFAGLKAVGESTRKPLE
ncbi:NAD-dependent epimerase/dehydratase family protein, partial [Erwinia amylovora]|uniref:GDP-mannose 4,6-dehydratase n=1 Tax=Erwinia amylovora TaxID=552 RepID=UPI000FE343A7